MEVVFLVVVITVFFMYSFKRVQDGQWLVVFQNGQVLKVIEKPGPIAILPFLQNVKTVDARIKSASIPEVFDDIDLKTPIAKGTFEYHVADALKAIANVNLHKDVEDMIVSALQRATIDASIAQCLCDAAVIEARVLELSKLKAATLGVAVISVKIEKFPRHRQLLVQIATMPYIVYWQLVEELQ